MIRWVGAMGVCAVLCAGAPAAAAADDGSLVRTTMQTEVGVVLDEIPASMRDRVATAMLAKPARFWTDRARMQMRLMNYRLVFRYAFYAGKAALPLPPEQVWELGVVVPARRHKVNGHDVVGADYSFSSVLVSDEASPEVSEPKLAVTGGKWHENFILPVDPEYVMQRTGYACMDESQFPFASVDSEEVDSFYDDSSVVEPELTKSGYHQTVMPTQSCADAVRDNVGKVAASLQFERIAYDAATASRYRVGDVTGSDPDLRIYQPDFDPSRTNYRYIHGGGSASCEVAEGSVGGTGWRRLLQFATSDENLGERDLTIGGVDYFLTGPPGALDLHNLYEWSPCHQHYHFKYYGDFSWNGGGKVVNSKKGFCLQATLRAANREGSPLHNPFGDCSFQGVSAGWLDQYRAGLSGQWLDTTTLREGTGTRAFVSNPNGFLCEGKFIDASGQPLGPFDPVVWGPTGLTGENGRPVEAPLCRQSPGWDANNSDSIQETIEPHGEGQITDDCEREQIGPLRNCGFGKRPALASCKPGAATTATFSVASGGAPQVVRLTEYSNVLRAAIPARYEDSWVPLQPGLSDQPAMLGNAVTAPGAPAVLRFTCPAPRYGGEFEPGGMYGIYTTPVLPSDPRSPVTRK